MTAGQLVNAFIMGLSIFVYLGSRFSQSVGEKFFKYFLFWIPLICCPILLISARVDFFASWWGRHATWKLGIASLIFVLFPILSFTFLSKLEKAWLRRTGYVYAGYMFISLIAMILRGWALFPHPVEGTPPPGIGLDWVLIHPTPAIHHTYANATYLGLHAALIASFLWGRPLSKALVRILRSQRNLDIITILIFVGSVVAMIFFP